MGWSAGLHVDRPCGGQISLWPAIKVAERVLQGARKRGGVQKSIGNKVPWKIGDADLSPCNFATTHFPAERSSFTTL